MDIADWLRSLGLEQYEPTFRNNAIDGAELPQLTPDNLKDIGVAQVGRRRKRTGWCKEASGLDLANLVLDSPPEGADAAVRKCAGHSVSVRMWCAELCGEASPGRRNCVRQFRDRTTSWLLEVARSAGAR